MQPRPALLLYVGAVCAAAVGGAAAVFVLDRSLDRVWLGLIAAALIGLSHLFETRVRLTRRERESYSHEEAWVVVLALLASPLVVVLAFAAGSTAGNLIVRREPLKGVFNVAAMTLQAAAAVAVVELVRGDDVAGARTAAAGVAGAAAFFLVNRLVMPGVLTLAGVATLRANLLDDLGGRSVVGLADAAVGTLAGLAAVTHIWTLPFGIAALAALHYTLSGHAAARAERQKLADLVASSSDGIVSVRRDGRIDAWNPACERLTGYAAEEVLGKTLDEISALLFAQRKQGRTRPLPALDAPAEGELFDVRIRRRDGSERWLAVTRAETPDRGAVIVLRDETRRRQAEELRVHEESERLRADLVAAVSHELRTPLTSMLGFTDTLLRRRLDDDEARRYLEIVREQGRRLSALIDDLLDLRVVVETRFDRPRERLDLREILEEQARELGANAPKHRLRLELPDRPTVVAGDPERLRQVVANLISNAIKYSPAGGDVVVRASVEANWVRTIVRDQGLGIPPDQQENIFERFFRVKGGHHATIRGSGLGLALSREIVAAHGGTIGFESAEGEGSTFYFDLPLAHDGAP